jgi:hypothetical protein
MSYLTYSTWKLGHNSCFVDIWMKSVHKTTNLWQLNQSQYDKVKVSSIFQNVLSKMLFCPSMEIVYWVISNLKPILLTLHLTTNIDMCFIMNKYLWWTPYLIIRTKQVSGLCIISFSRFGYKLVFMKFRLQIVLILCWHTRFKQISYSRDSNRKLCRKLCTLLPCFHFLFPLNWSNPTKITK